MCVAAFLISLSNSLKALSFHIHICLLLYIRMTNVVEWLLYFYTLLSSSEFPFFKNPLDMILMTFTLTLGVFCLYFRNACSSLTFLTLLNGTSICHRSRFFISSFSIAILLQATSSN